MYISLIVDGTRRYYASEEGPPAVAVRVVGREQAWRFLSLQECDSVLNVLKTRYQLHSTPQIYEQREP
jgi:hypothetical protein